MPFPSAFTLIQMERALLVPQDMPLLVENVELPSNSVVPGSTPTTEVVTMSVRLATLLMPSAESATSVLTLPSTPTAKESAQSQLPP